MNVTNYFGANGVFARKSGSGMNTLYKNGHGDTVLLTNGSTVVRDYDYDAYGKEKGISSADLNPFRYSGEYFDSETGFIYLRNRYYDPGTGRFISEDPHWNVDNCIYGDAIDGNKPTTPDIGAIIQSTNLFAYCMGNPIMYVDCDGEVAVIASGALLALGKAIVITGIGYELVSILKLAKEQITEAKQRVSNAKNVSPSSGINWGDENNHHHVLTGSNGHESVHGKIWKKFGIDPNGNGGWDKLLPILKEVVDEKQEIGSGRTYDSGKLTGYVVEYAKDYWDKGVRVIVKLYTDLEGKVWLSDAYGKELQ